MTIRYALCSWETAKELMAAIAGAEGTSVFNKWLSSGMMLTVLWLPWS
jgi:hypothetical protein